MEIPLFDGPLPGRVSVQPIVWGGAGLPPAELSPTLWNGLDCLASIGPQTAPPVDLDRLLATPLKAFLCPLSGKDWRLVELSGGLFGLFAIDTQNPDFGHPPIFHGYCVVSQHKDALWKALESKFDPAKPAYFFAGAMTPAAKAFSDEAALTQSVITAKDADENTGTTGEITAAKATAGP